MQSSNRIPLSRFPADLFSLLLLPGGIIFYVVASYLPRFRRATLFAVLGLLFIVTAFYLARGSRGVVRWLTAAVYAVMGIGCFYIAYLEGVLFG